MITNAAQPVDLIGVTARFISRVEKRGECWIWTGATNSKGYPQIRVGSKVFYAHRFSHTLYIGFIPDGHQVHHKCMNPLCVAPEHLEAVTPDVNRKLQALGVGEIDDIPF